MTNPNEEQFEAAICASLAGSGGYTAIKNDRLQGEPRDFNPVRGLDTVELFAGSLAHRQVGAPNQSPGSSEGLADLLVAATAEALRRRLRSMTPLPHRWCTGVDETPPSLTAVAESIGEVAR